MHISYNTSPSGLNLDTGYGLAGYGIVTSLQRCGHIVTFKDPTAPVEIAFCMPDDSEWSSPTAYHIQMTPWESTKLKPTWAENFNKADEVWATSQWVADVYRAEGVTVPIFVYEHGIDTDWTPRRRRITDGVVKFLHVGEPAPRKGGQMAMEAFHDAFGNRKDVSLTIKAWRHSTIRVYDRQRSILGLPHEIYPNMRTIDKNLEGPEMVYLFHRHDVLVYPSMGEGFGFIPLQALATGMPVIVTNEWPPYSRFVLPELSIGTTPVPSAWPTMHPGNLLQPDYDDLKASYLNAFDSFDRLAGVAYKNSLIIRDEYNWDHLTNKAFAHIVKKFSQSLL